MIRTLVSAVALASAGLAACSTGPISAHIPAARLSFAAQGTVEGFLGSFRTLDGKDVEGAPALVELPPGRHTVGYWCPNHIVLDGPPTVTATFEAGKEYVLHCQGNEQGRVERR